VEAEDSVVYQRCQRKIVEHVCEVFPNDRVAVLPKALIVEAVYLRDLTGLVVSAENRYSVRIPNLGGWIHPPKNVNFRKKQILTPAQLPSISGRPTFKQTSAVTVSTE